MNQRGVFAKYGFICSFKIQFLCVKQNLNLIVCNIRVFFILLLWCTAYECVVDCTKKAQGKKRRGSHVDYSIIFILSKQHISKATPNWFLVLWSFCWKNMGGRAKNNFFIEIENFRDEGNFDAAHTWHNFFWKNLDFYKILEKGNSFSFYF